jgi:hypothetical protein
VHTKTIYDKSAKDNPATEPAGDEKCVLPFTKRKRRQSKFQTLTFTLCDADILIKPLPFCKTYFSDRQFKAALRGLRREQDQLVALLLMLIDWLDFHITIQGLS